MNSPETAADMQAAFCSVLVDEWARAGVTDAVLAPGSRSTPLVLALAQDARIRVHVVLDERAVGFVVLGLGLSARRPAVAVTTSGTAAVELHPAVVEASQAGVPMIVATADRPPQLHLVGAPQTVEQEGLFGRSPRWAFTAGLAQMGMAWSWRSVASRCVAEAMGGTSAPGPVHINLPFDEPLFGDGSRVDAPPGRSGGTPWHEWRVPDPPAPPEPVGDLLASYAGARGLVIAGQGAGGPALVGAAERLGWPVFADPRSGCRIPDGPVVAAADALLRIPEVAAGHPDVVVRAGDPWASKVLNQWLASLPPDVPQLLSNRWGTWVDPERRASHFVVADPASLLEMTAVRANHQAQPTEWCSWWMTAETAAQEALDAQLGRGGALELSEPAIARAVLGGLDEGSQLLVSSSMPVRDVEWYGASRAGVSVLSNRGANGIDGVLSTSLGAALAAGQPTAVLIGDLAFLYDAGALMWSAGREVRLTVIVVDNDGGGIFSFLPHATSVPAPEFERYWGTPHGADLSALAAAYGVPATAVASRADLDAVLSDAGKRGVRLAIVRTNRSENVTAHERLHEAVAASVRAGGAGAGSGGAGGFL
jgi:2-succinyl-5-enolpyruvyl-6-hydroxy-3-cyclohexene-1-carboxylate synthase